MDCYRRIGNYVIYYVILISIVFARAEFCVSLTTLSSCYNIVLTMLQSVIKVGNSIGVIIPKALAGKSLKRGDKVFVEKDPASGTYLIHKNGKKTTSSITPHFLQVLDRVNKQYGRAFRAIANR